jgi:hypothetical protein
MIHFCRVHQEAGVVVILGCLVLYPGLAEQRTYPSFALVRLQVNPDISRFESEALANRALHHVHAFSTRLHSIVSRWCSTPAERSPVRPQVPPGLHGSDGSPDEKFGAGETEWNTPRLNAASIESIEYLNLLVDFGVMQPPWVKDLTGQLGAAPTVAETTAFLRRHPTALVLLHWSPRETPLMARLLHEVTSDILPLSQSAQVDYLRKQFRDVRMIWVIKADANEPPPSQEVRDAGEHLLAFAATFGGIKAKDPSLAILAGSEEEHGTALGNDKSSDDFTMVEEALREAEDLAVWDGDTSSALRLLADARRFSEQKVASVVEPAEKERYRILATQASQMSRDLAAAPFSYSARAREGAWKAASPEAYGLLENAIGTGILVEVPGDGVSAQSSGGEFEVIALGVGPEEVHRTLAPWLYGIEVSVLQPVGVLYNRDEMPVLTGLPVGLVNTATGYRHIRRFVRDESEIPEYELSIASFLNLVPGTYRVELVSLAARNSLDRPAVSSAGANAPSFASRSWWRALISIGRRWRWPGSSRRVRLFRWWFSFWQCQLLRPQRFERVIRTAA